MNFIKNNLANAFTLCNLLAGCIGAIHIIQGDYITTTICLLFSLTLDFFDGFVARAMKSDSNLGIQLDSLADMVSFGLIPGLAMFKMLEPFGANLFGVDLPFDIKYFGLLITLFSCLRLAIFNIDDDQTYYFKGLNTPTNTIFIFGIFYFFKHETSPSNAFGQVEMTYNHLGDLLVLLTILCSWLLVSPIKMISLKFRSMQLKDNVDKLILLVGIIILLAVFQLAGIPLAVVFYIVVSLLFQKKLTNT